MLGMPGTASLEWTTLPISPDFKSVSFLSYSLEFMICKREHLSQY